MITLNLHKSECLYVLNNVRSLILFVWMSGWSDILKFQILLAHVSLKYNYIFTLFYFVLSDVFRL